MEWSARQGARGVASCYARPTQHFWLMHMAAEFPYIKEAAARLLSAHVTSCARALLIALSHCLHPGQELPGFAARTRPQSCACEKVALEGRGQMRK
eukprot:1140332-Pelagomonas_calceolata.AAC.4